MDVALFTTQLNQLLQTPADPDHLENVCDLLRMHTSATIRVENREGRVLAECLAETAQPLFVDEMHCQATHTSLSREQFPKLIRKAGEISCLSLDADVGKLILQRESPFDEAEKLAANITLCICTILLRHREGLLSADKKRRAKAVRAIINSLSFSELEATSQILKTLDASEGLLVAGHIADKLGFTRSVVTGALRKLEGANLIETRSLGMKGTYIRVKDALLTEELAKL